MKIRLSLFTKLFLVIIATGVVVNLLVGGFFRYQFIHSTRSVFRANIGIYADYLIGQLGSPPDPAKARELSKKTMLDISIEGPGLSWSTAPVPGGLAYRAGGKRIGNARYLWHGGKFLLSEERGPYRYRFYSTGVPFQWAEEYAVFLIMLLTAVLIGSYALIRRLLRPVKLLAAGVREIAAGNLDYQVPVRSRDELGELTESFNGMKSRLKEMVLSREQLLLDVSHELRSPLTRIKVALEFIEDRAARGTIDEEVREIEGMISEILETERLKYLDGKLDTAEIDMAQLAEEIAVAMNPRAALAVEQRRPPVMVKGDRAWIKIVVRNVLENAAKYSAPGAHPIEIFFGGGDDRTDVIIRDSGTGIPEKELPFVFEPFYRVDSSRSRNTGGYGLGLSICKKIMEAHGGDIEIHSSPGSGTSVILQFRK